MKYKNIMLFVTTILFIIGCNNISITPEQVTKVACDGIKLGMQPILVKLAERHGIEVTVNRVKSSKLATEVILVALADKKVKNITVKELNLLLLTFNVESKITENEMKLILLGFNSLIIFFEVPSDTINKELRQSLIKLFTELDSSFNVFIKTYSNNTMRRVMKKSVKSKELELKFRKTKF